jgi:hypothetical protein
VLLKQVRSPQRAVRFRSFAFPLFIATCMAAPCARSADAVARFGMQRAATAPLPWDVRNAAHPVLGPIRFAVLRKTFTTAVGANTVYSNVYVSCEIAARRIAIELTNEKAAGDPGGLKPVSAPALTCNGFDPSRGNRATTEPLKAQWTVNDLGDAMARGLWPSELRQCVSIGITQEVQLPKGWSRDSLRIDFAITSYARELDDVFAACGEPSVYAAAAKPTAPSPAAAAPPATQAPAPSAPLTAAPPTQASASPAPPPREAAIDRPWLQAHVVAKGRANVHAGPSADAAVVATLDPGAPVSVQFAGGTWWRVRSGSQTSPDGYIQRERLLLK